MSAVTLDHFQLESRPINFLSKLIRVLLTLSLLAVAAMAFVLFHFAMPVWDDLVRATRPLEIGWWRYVMGFVYCHWQGRWASAGFEAFILPKVDITRFYFLLIGFTALVDAIGVYVVCRWFTRLKSRKTSAAVAAGLLALLWAGIPSLGETIYWFTGAVENSVVISLAAMVLIALLRNDAKPNPLYVAALSLAALIVCGFHELYGAMFCMALIAGMIGAWIMPGKSKAAWTAVTIGAVIGLIIVAIAPGNSSRLAAEKGAHGKHFLYDGWVAFDEFAAYAPRWFFDPKLIAATLFVAFSPTLKANRSIWRWTVPAVWAAMVGLGFFAPSWAFGVFMPARTLSGNYIVFVIGWLVSVYLWSPFLRRMLPPLTRRSSDVINLALLVFAISLLTVGNFTTSRRDLRDRLRPWHTGVERRWAQLRKARGTDALVTTLPKPPWVLLNGEVVDDPTDYRNWSTVDFFHLRSIRIQPATGEPILPPPAPTRPPAEKIGY